MERFLGRYSDHAYALLRIVIGVLFAMHGIQKLFHVWGGEAIRLDPLLTAAAVIELGGGVLVALGLLGGYAAFVASGEMAVAYFIGHAPKGFLPIVNQGEPAVVYCFLFLFLASRGSGRFSIDALLRAGRPEGKRIGETGSQPGESGRKAA